MSAEAALATLPGFSDPRRGATVDREGAASRKLARSSRNARGRRRRSTSSTPSAASGGLTARRGTARATVRGVRRDAAATRAAIRRRARAWSAGGDGSACGSTEYNSEYDSAGEDEELDSLLEWSAGLDFEAFDAHLAKAARARAAGGLAARRSRNRTACAPRAPTFATSTRKDYRGFVAEELLELGLCLLRRENPKLKAPLTCLSSRRPA